MVDVFQGRTKVTSPREIAVIVGLAGRFLEDAVRLLRQGHAGCTPRQILDRPAEILELTHGCSVDAFNGQLEVVGDVRSGEAGVVVANVAQSATDRGKVRLRAGNRGGRSAPPRRPSVISGP